LRSRKRGFIWFTAATEIVIDAVPNTFEAASVSGFIWFTAATEIAIDAVPNTSEAASVSRKRGSQAKGECERRYIFISATALARKWLLLAKLDAVKVDQLRVMLDSSLLFFGSKRRWLFPTTTTEKFESQKQGNYAPPTFPQELLDIIKQKEAREPSEVYFLKPPALDYKGFGNGCHSKDPNAPAFAGASTWLESHGLKPLKLDRDWWLGDGHTNTSSFTGARGEAVVANYEIGEHDYYNPCIELLNQSNPDTTAACYEPQVTSS
jgi:hypothetical protein